MPALSSFSRTEVLGTLLPPGLELHIVNGDAVEGSLEITNGAHDRGAEVVREDVGRERVWGLKD